MGRKVLCKCIGRKACCKCTIGRKALSKCIQASMIQMYVQSKKLTLLSTVRRVMYFLFVFKEKIWSKCLLIRMNGCHQCVLLIVADERPGMRIYSATDGRLPKNSCCQQSNILQHYWPLQYLSTGHAMLLCCSVLHSRVQ